MNFEPPGSCSPHQQCDYARSLIAQATEGLPSIQAVQSITEQLSHCPPCAQGLQVELRFKMAMAQSCRQQAPPSLQLRISESLKRVDLSQIDVTDL